MSTAGGPGDREGGAGGGRGGFLFWAVSLGLALYVALCTGHRDAILEADAWEHHRAIVELTRDLWNPQNPTYASPETSIRFSPYIAMLAAVARTTGADPWDVLSGAAVFNTLLMAAGVLALLRAMGRASAAGLALIVMVSLYGGAPGYANSYALADLPWHQVNPSAFAFGVVLLAWAMFLDLAGGAHIPRGWAVAGWLALPVMMTAAMLDHAMTGVAGFVGLGVFALLGGPRESPGVAERVYRVGTVGVIALATLGGCAAWPWYSFIQAVTLRPDNDYWFNPYILRMMLVQWCAPAILLSVWALTARDRAPTRLMLAVGAACLGLGLAAIAGRSATLARVPLPGLVFFHLAIALTAEEAGLLSWRAWRERSGALWAGREGAAPAALAVLASAALVYFLVPQVLAIVREPHLARAYVAPLTGREEKGVRHRALYKSVLEPVEQGEVVLGLAAVTWPAPSFGARIVAGSHYEFFVPGQRERDRDMAVFFGEAAGEAERGEILSRYGARWILVDEPQAPAGVIREGAVAKRAGTLVLMDAERWRREPAGADQKLIDSSAK